MQKLQISYVTWTRSDANGLFDYEDLKDRNPDDSLLVEHSGYICRRKEDYKIHFSSSKVDEAKYQQILKVTKRDNHYILSSLDIKNEPLFKIIEKDYPKTHQIKKGDTLKLGKVTVEVLELQFKLRKRISSYALIKMQMDSNPLTAIREITPQFYEPDQTKTCNLETSLQSCYEENPTCRYCYSKTITETNPFIVSCGCIGSAKYIHEKCLLQWFLRRGSIKQKPNSGVLYAEEKIFKCELCHQFFYIPDLWRKFFEYQKQNQKNLQCEPFKQVLILHVKYQNNWLFFIDLSKKREVLIGRSIENQVILNDLSVSRSHAKLQIHSEEKVITLSNNNAKFGTLVQLSKVEVQNDENYQVGRTKMSFKKHQKKSFFDKIGLFCFVKQKLNNEVQKNHSRQKFEMQEKQKEEKQQQISEQINQLEVPHS